MQLSTACSALGAQNGTRHSLTRKNKFNSIQFMDMAGNHHQGVTFPALHDDLLRYIFGLCPAEDAWALLRVDARRKRLLCDGDAGSRPARRRPSDEHVVASGITYLEWALAGGWPWPKKNTDGLVDRFWACALAAGGGSVEVLKRARADGCPLNEGTCSSAARGGHLDVLKWARENGCPWDKYTCSGAASGGHLDVLKWARESGCPWD